MPRHSVARPSMVSGALIGRVLTWLIDSICARLIDDSLKSYRRNISFSAFVALSLPVNDR